MRTRYRYTINVFMCTLAVTSTGVSASSWFESETRKCEFNASVSLNSPFKRSKNAVGGEYFTVPKGDLNTILSTKGGAVRSSRPLSQTEVRNLKSRVEAMRTGPEAISTVLGIASNISDFSGVFALASGGLMGWLAAHADAEKLSVDRLVDFVTIGGAEGYEVAFRSAPTGFKPLIFVATSYEIQVGTEPRPRRWLFSACLLPIEVELVEVETTGGMNEKRLLRQQDGTWRQWDVTDQKYERRFLYIKQDEVYAYFQNADDPERYTRIHMYGGPWEHTNDGITWKTLYLTTKSK